MVMPLTDVKTAIDKEDKQSVQFRAEGNTALTFPGQGGAFGDLWGFAFRLAGDSEGLPAWWSPIRDKFLRTYTRHNPILSSVIRGEKARVRNMSYTLSLEDGRSRKINRYHDMLRDCDFGKGFRSFSEKLAGDLLSLDNGGFIELIGKGGNRETQRPLDKADIDTFAYLDSCQCWRTYDPEYPVVYTSPYNGSYHIMHYTRVIALADNEQGDELARGIGLSAASRAFEIARYIFDMETYKREKVSGESPEIWLLNGPMSVKQFQQGLITGKMGIDNQGTVKFKNSVVVGPPGTTGANNQPTTLTSVGIKNVPDGFNFKDELTVAMYILAMAFNVDIREYFPLQAGGATRADAGVQHEKSSGKGRATIWTLIEDAINYRVLPDYVTFQYDVQDDIEDKQKAEIKQIRTNTYATMISSGIASIPEVRIMAAEAGDIDPDFLENPIVADDTTAPGEGSAGDMENDESPEDEVEVESTNPTEGEKSDLPKVLAVADKGINGTRAFFATDMSQIVEQAKPYGGNLRQGQFGSQLRRIISTASIQALLDGFRDGGVIMKISETDDATANALNEHIISQWEYADSFANAVFGGLAVATALSHIPMWTNKVINAMYNYGLLAAKDNQRLEWVYGPTEHCSDCLSLNGKVYTAKVWREAEIMPQGDMLECGGFNCKCELKKTDKPLSEGKPELSTVGGKKPRKRKKMVYQWTH